MDKSKAVNLVCKIVLTAVILPLIFFASLFIGLIVYDEFIAYALIAVLAAFFVPMIWFKNKKKVLVYWGIFFAVTAVICGVKYGIEAYDRSITVNPTPNINVHEYLPFEEDSKIIKLDQEASLELSGNLPRIDGAAAVFPVYSAFVNAVYPETTELWDGVFEYKDRKSVV